MEGDSVVRLRDVELDQSILQRVIEVAVGQQGVPGVVLVLIGELQQDGILVQTPPTAPTHIDETGRHETLD